MKKIIAILGVALLVAACQHDVVYEVDYQVSLDKENSYKAGEPVRFNFSGSVDNIVFYSGESGHAYKFKDRYEVDMEDVLSASLGVDYQARYGKADGLEVWVSKEFKGLSGNDVAADKALIKEMVDGEMSGWERLDYQEGASTKWTHQDYEINDYMQSFCIAFHWNPVDFKQVQRTYWIKGGIVLNLKGMAPSTVKFSDIDFVSLMMDPQENGQADEFKYEDPYVRNEIVYPSGVGEKNKGIFIFNNQETADIICQGTAANKLKFCIDGWAISKPMALNRIANDKGVVIKNLQNYLDSYEYTWEEPGTYTVTFVGTNSNYAGESRVIKEMTITIF